MPQKQKEMKICQKWKVSTTYKWFQARLKEYIMVKYKGFSFRVNWQCKHLRQIRNKFHQWERIKIKQDISRRSCLSEGKFSFSTLIRRFIC